MNSLHLFSTGLFFFLCSFFTQVNAQCHRTQSANNKTKADVQTEKLNKACSQARTYYSCQAKRASCRSKKEDTRMVFTNTLLVLGGATIDKQSNMPAIATGLEYNRQWNRTIGLGALAEVRTNADKNLSLRFGVPVNFRPIRQVQISAGPLMGANRKTVSEVVGGTLEEPELGSKNEWNNEFGARASVSYLIQLGHFVIAPTVKVDYLADQVEPTFGVNLGMGF